MYIGVNPWELEGVVTPLILGWGIMGFP